MRPETKLGELLRPRNQRPKPMERLLLSVDDCGVLHIMCRRGPGIEEEDASITPEELNIPPPKATDYDGLWVYDVTPQFVPDHEEGFATQYGSLEYDNGTYRRPTDKEWMFIKDGYLLGLFAYWEDVTSSEQWSELLKKDEEEAKKP